MDAWDDFWEIYGGFYNDLNGVLILECTVISFEYVSFDSQYLELHASDLGEFCPKW